jgi:hypothetical protein
MRSITPKHHKSQHLCYQYTRSLWNGGQFCEQNDSRRVGGNNNMTVSSDSNMDETQPQQQRTNENDQQHQAMKMTLEYILLHVRRWSDWFGTRTPSSRAQRIGHKRSVDISAQAHHNSNTIELGDIIVAMNGQRVHSLWRTPNTQTCWYS